MIRFVSFRSPTRGSPTRSSDPARRRDPSSITVTVAPPSDRASARRRVAPARDRRDASARGTLARARRDARAARDDDANDGIAMMGTDGARRANRAGFGAGADGERGGRGGAFEGDARARGGEGDEITARSMRLTTMRARWWMFGFTVEDDAV